jgi:PKD repeat protein
MVPDQNGTVVSFSSGDVQTVTLNFSLQPAWPLEDCEFVAWLQNYDAGQGNCPGGTVKRWTTLQGIKRGVIDLTPDFSVAATTVNKGEAVTFTNTTHGGYIGVPEVYEWIFDGATPSTSTEQNPVVTYNECGAHDVTLIVNRGGQVDTLIRTAYIQVGPAVNVVADPGFLACWYSGITLDATTPGATTYLWSPGGETTPTIDVTYAQYGLGSHDFTVTVNASGCENVQQVTAVLDACTGVGEKSQNISMSAYPNPNSGSFAVEFNAPGTFMADLNMVNSLGMSVYAEKNLTISGKFTKNLNLSGLAAGIYMLSLQNSETRVVQKIVIK